MGSARERRGIGTLGEKTLHAVLKQYFEPDMEHMEVRVGPFVADIKGENGIIEIQTANFYSMRRKLELFLVDNQVTVVYPVAARKWLIWIEKDGSFTPRRKSPKHASPCQILPELSKIRPFLLNENLRFCIVMLELEEYRLKNGWSDDGKKGSTKYETMPVSLIEEIWLNSPEDYLALFPDSLPNPFTAKELSRAAKLSHRNTSFSLGVLKDMGAVEYEGKRGKEYLYRITGR